MSLSPGARLGPYEILAPIGDATGTTTLKSVAVSGDGRSYAYASSAAFSELYVVEGVK